MHYYVDFIKEISYNKLGFFNTKLYPAKKKLRNPFRILSYLE